MKKKKDNIEPKVKITRKEREKRFKSAYYDWVKYLEEQAEPYTVEYTHGRRTVISAYGKETFTKGGISKTGMNFIKATKNAIIKSGITEKIPRKTQEELGLQYIYFNKKYMGENLTNVIELDLTAAYWDAAYKLEVISKDVYYKGLGLSKVERLASLGSLARLLKVRKFDGKKHSKAIVKDGSETTKHVWFAISNEIDKVMKKCARELKDQLVFYWIDALFLINTKENKKLVEEIIKGTGYKFKFVKIEKVYMGNDRAMAWSKEKGEHIDKESGMPMRFFAYDVENADLFKIGTNKK